MVERRGRYYEKLIRSAKLGWIYIYIYIYIYNTIIKMFKFVSTLILISYSLERPCDAC